MKKIAVVLTILSSFTFSIFHAHKILLKDANAIKKLTHANKLIEKDQLQEAINIYQEVLACDQENPELWYNLAYILRVQGNPEAAIDAYEQSILLNSNNEDAYLGLAKSYLATGKFIKGWENFEYRYKDVKSFKQKKIDPKNFAGKTVLILSEWGLGDTIQFIRYAKMVKQYGAKKVILQTFNPLVQLFLKCDYIDQIVKHGEYPNHDIKIPMLSLPLIFDTTIETIPTYNSYIYADPQLITYWGKKLACDKNLKVGLCWHAKPNFIEKHLHTKRSVSLETFAPLANVDGVSFYSLQQIHGVSQLDNLPAGFVVKTFGNDFDKSHGRFMDTAAVIKNLDLIISVDTSIVHLAGALGQNVWVLIPYSAEWRWMLKRNNTPWYNNMKLFRQSQLGNWQHVIGKIKNELEILTQLG